MIERWQSLVASWWRMRTERERTLLRVVLIVAFGVLLPFALYQGAAHYRAAAAADIAGAREIAANVARIAAAGPVTAGPTEGALRAIAVAAAEAGGLSIARAEPMGDRLRLVLEPADSLRVYQWMEAIGRRGVFINRTSMVRAGDTDLVVAEFELAPGP